MSNIKPSKNALYGYTYQENITFFLLAKMDVEREIESIEMEVTVDHKFDDAKIILKGKEHFFQMKDIENISFNDLKITKKSIFIQRKEHKLSTGINLLFFKEIQVDNNSEIFGLPAYNHENLYIISSSRETIATELEKLYFQNENRILVIDKYFKRNLDNRKNKLKFIRGDLPKINYFGTELLELTIIIGKKNLEFNNLLHIEGKPGVGKSHLVKTLAGEYPNHILYRFWVSNQDQNYNDRLNFQKFLFDISKKLFGDQLFHSEDNIIQNIINHNQVLIIDGLDHVENYAKDELNLFITFIEKLKVRCKVIVLSRPLKIKLDWKKQILQNWNEVETFSYLEQGYKIIDYSIKSEIFKKTDGYPILVHYFSENFLKFNIIPDVPELKSLEDFYDSILNNVDLRNHLTLFISATSFFMESELNLFLNDSVDYVKEYIATYPYLFEIQLNRICLFHDSFNTYLRKQSIDNSKIIERINEIVFQSILNGEKKFLSRFSNFSLTKEMKLKIIQKYCSIDEFENLRKDAIDIEAIDSFYNQIREAIQELSPEDLSIHNYYEFALIKNCLGRDLALKIEKFLNTYAKCLLFNGFTEEDITSSKYLYGMFYFLKTNDLIYLNRQFGNEHENIQNFEEKLNAEIESEKNYFSNHYQPIELKYSLSEILNNHVNFDLMESIPVILANLYIHTTKDEELIEFQKSIHEYMKGNINSAYSILNNDISKKTGRRNSHSVEYYLRDSKIMIESLGFGKESSKYRDFNLEEFILKNRDIGYFSMWVQILNYLRLSIEDNRKIDLGSISLFWLMYEERKDYSVVNIDVALKTFEDKKLITEEESIEIIKFTQNMSEKGIRHLLTSYIKLHNPKIIDKILSLYRMNDLQIQWLDLPANFIDSIPEELFKIELNKLINYGSYNKQIDYEEIKNVFESKYKNELLRNLEFMHYIIKISESSPMINELKKLNLPLEILKNKEENSNDSSISRYNDGILTNKDIDFIEENNISLLEISGFTDGNYNVFAELEIFSLYPKEDLTKNIRAILYISTIAKIRKIEKFGLLKYFIGNLPKFLLDLDVHEDYEKLYKSFNKFLKLSLLIESDKI